MAKLFFLAIAFVAITFVSAYEPGSTCTLNQVTLGTYLTTCLADNPAMMFQVMEHMNKPQSMEQYDFICKNRRDIVDVFMCMKDKVVSCYQNYKDVMSQVFPSRDKWEMALDFMCEHKAELFGSTCLQIQDYLPCLKEKLASISTPSIDDIQSIVCRVINSEEQCIQANHGTCSQEFLSLLFKLLEIVFPISTCPVTSVDMKSQEMKNALGSILVRGQPLQFKPQREAPYNIMQGL